MHHDTPLISTIVAGLVLAYIFGMIANRVKLPPLVGYLFAGILVGPYTPGFVADQKLGAELAELGVILLMFGVGLHFSLKDLMSVRALAIPGAIVQIGVATLLGAGLGLALGWDLGGSLLFGLALSVASTVVLLKALQDRRLLETERGRIAVGWLIVEDLAMVLALVLVPAIATLNGVDTGVHDPFVSFVERMFNTPVGIWGVLAITLVKVAAFVGFMLVVGRRIIPWALHLTAHTGSRELFRLAVLAIALGVALGSAVLFGVSLALGAFFAGMILSESELSHRAANETLPLRDAFAVLFFVSVGMLFDPSIILTDPLPVLATVFIIVIGKSLAALGIVLLFRRPVGTALTISASLAQIGEFSFILASMGVALTIMPAEAQSLILAGALISIVLNPVIFWAVEVIRPGLETRFGGRVATASEPHIEPGDIGAASHGPATTDLPGEAAVDRGALGADDDLVEPITLKGHSVLVGYGQVGRIVADGLKAAGHAIVVIEDSDHDVATARASELEVIYGNAARQDTLRLANLAEARNLVVAISNAFEAGTVVESGRKLNPGISIIARAYSEEEESFLRNLGATTVIRGEREIGKGILGLLKDEAEAVPDQNLDDGVRLPPADNVVAQAASAIIAAAPIVVAPSAEEETDPIPVIVEPLPVVEAVADLEVGEVPPAAVTDAVVVPTAELVEIAPPVLDAEPAAKLDEAEEPVEEAALDESEQSADEDGPARPYDDVIILPPPAAELPTSVEDVPEQTAVELSPDDADEPRPVEVAEAPGAGDAGADAGEEKIDSEDDDDKDPPVADAVPVVKPEPRE